MSPFQQVQTLQKMKKQAAKSSDSVLSIPKDFLLFLLPKEGKKKAEIEREKSVKDRERERKA